MPSSLKSRPRTTSSRPRESSNFEKHGGIHVERSAPLPLRSIVPSLVKNDCQRAQAFPKACDPDCAHPSVRADVLGRYTGMQPVRWHWYFLYQQALEIPSNQFGTATHRQVALQRWCSRYGRRSSRHHGRRNPIKSLSTGCIGEPGSLPCCVSPHRARNEHQRANREMPYDPTQCYLCAHATASRWLRVSTVRKTDCPLFLLSPRHHQAF